MSKLVLRRGESSPYMQPVLKFSQCRPIFSGNLNNLELILSSIRLDFIGRLLYLFRHSKHLRRLSYKNRELTWQEEKGKKAVSNIILNQEGNRFPRSHWISCWRIFPQIPASSSPPVLSPTSHAPLSFLC